MEGGSSAQNSTKAFKKKKALSLKNFALRNSRHLARTLRFGQGRQNPEIKELWVCQTV